MKPKETKDDEVFIPSPQEITTLSGEKVQVPKLNWKKEILIARSFTNIFKSLPELKKVDWEKGITVSQVLESLPDIMEKVPDEITKIVSIALDKETKWVEENLDFESIAGLVVPFFSGYFQKLSKLASKVQKSNSERS